MFVFLFLLLIQKKQDRTVRPAHLAWPGQAAAESVGEVSEGLDGEGEVSTGGFA